MQIFIYCKVTLHVSGVTAPIIGMHGTMSLKCDSSFEQAIELSLKMAQ